MHPLTPRRLILLGIGLILCGLGLAVGNNPVAAQGSDQAEYTGASTCASCHRKLSRAHDSSLHGLALVDVSSDKSAIKADFKQGDKERTVTLPGESAARPFTKDDVAYVVGAGKNVQRFLYEVDKDKYAVFPAEWNVAKKAWQPYLAGKTWPDDSAYDWTQNCAGCHTTGLNASRDSWEDDGVQCEACHGPGSTHVDLADKAGSEPSDEDLKSIRAAIVLTSDAQVCGQCHSQGTEPDKKLPYSVAYRPGGNLLDPAVFSLVAPDSADHWWASGHARQRNMQFNEWLRSAHSNSLTVLQTAAQKGQQVDPACLDCHSADYRATNTLIEAQKAGTRKGAAPQPLTPETAKYGVTCTTCHNPHKESNFNLVVDDTYALCTSCHRDTDVTKDVHNATQEMFEGKTIVKEVEGIPSVHFSSQNGPKCTTCHMPDVPIDGVDQVSHSLKPVLPGTANMDGVKDSCTSCHTEVQPEQMQKFIADAQSETKSRVKAIKVALKDSSPEWTRTALAFVEGDRSWGVHNHRYTAALLTAVEVNLGLAQTAKSGGAADAPVQNPADCGQCHQKEYQLWHSSPHARASLNEPFRKEFAAQKQPTYCMGCHASGYDEKTGKYVFEGVVCSNCHSSENNVKHPPAPMKVITNSADCGQCHSSAHAPSYEEWLTSAHSKAGVDCVDCHFSHNNGLRQGDANTTCGGCHKDALVDQVHMGSNMNCVDCHMKKQLDEAGIHVVKTGHSMSIDPATCANCHGKTHVLSTKQDVLTPDENQKVVDLQTQVDNLNQTAQRNWATGIAGGAVGMLLVTAVGFVILRRGKLL
jgi:predicted CXXCH cytochrome family protein